MIQPSTSTQQSGPMQAQSLLLENDSTFHLNTAKWANASTKPTPWEWFKLPPQHSKVGQCKHKAYSLRMIEPSTSTQQSGPMQAQSLLLENNRTSTSTQQGGPRYAHSLLLENNQTSTSTQQGGPRYAHSLLLENNQISTLTQQGGPTQAYRLLLENNQTSTSTQQSKPRCAIIIPCFSVGVHVSKNKLEDFQGFFLFFSGT